MSRSPANRDVPARVRTASPAAGERHVAGDRDPSPAHGGSRHCPCARERLDELSAPEGRLAGAEQHGVLGQEFEQAGRSLALTASDPGHVQRAKVAFCRASSVPPSPVGEYGRETHGRNRAVSGASRAQASGFARITPAAATKPIAASRSGRGTARPIVASARPTARIDRPSRAAASLRVSSFPVVEHDGIEFAHLSATSSAAYVSPLKRQIPQRKAGMIVPGTTATD